jgi:hypothetical protein
VDIDPAYWGQEVVEVGDGAPGPVVFHFRPTRYLVVDPQRREDWQDLFARNVGLRPDLELAHEWSGDPRETISGSGDGWDDCDYW